MKVPVNRSVIIAVIQLTALNVFLLIELVQLTAPNLPLTRDLVQRIVPNGVVMIGYTVLPSPERHVVDESYLKNLLLDRQRIF